MSKKIQISPESLPCGGIELKIEVTDTALLGKDSTLTIGKEVFVKEKMTVSVGLILLFITKRREVIWYGGRI